MMTSPKPVEPYARAVAKLGRGVSRPKAAVSLDSAAEMSDKNVSG
jgi:hypothetical protein